MPHRGAPNVGQVAATTRPFVFGGRPRRVSFRSGDEPARKRLKGLLAAQVGGKTFRRQGGKTRRSS